MEPAKDWEAAMAEEEEDAVPSQSSWGDERGSPTQVKPLELLCPWGCLLLLLWLLLPLHGLSFASLLRRIHQRRRSICFLF
jgi:hypothetical protein